MTEMLIDDTIGKKVYDVKVVDFTRKLHIFFERRRLLEDLKMQRYEKLSPCFYGVEMFYGKIDLKLTRRFSCFFIVEHTNDKRYIKDQIIQLFLAGCRDFHFYGAYAPVWRHCWDEVVIMLYPDPTPETVGVAFGWDSIEDFVDELNMELSCRGIVPHEEYLIYDDAGIYAQVLGMLGSRLGGRNGFSKNF